MAIQDMKGTVSTTGMVNNLPAKIQAPDMSKIKMPTADKSKQVTQKPVEQPQEEGLLERVQNLTNEDKNLLSTFLSPSVTNALKKIAPELTPLLDQAGTAEENVIIPVSVVKNFAAKRYGGEDETQAVTSFIADLQESAPGMNNEMEQSNVPPDTQMANQPD